MTKDFAVLALMLTSFAVCIPMLLMAVIALRTGISPYGTMPQAAPESDVQKQAVADLEKFDAAIARAKAQHLARLANPSPSKDNMT